MRGTSAGHPEKLGKYVIESVLGQGAMGVVYRARDPLIERTVALKTIRLDLLDLTEQAAALARFRREAQAVGRLNHPNIVTLYDYGEEGNILYIAMEFIKGRELKSVFLERERFAIPAIVDIMVQLLEALEYSHSQGVVHRDIKPGNIMIMDNGRIKVTDFGIARIESSCMTQVGAVLGTPSYMSPEQYTGQPVDGRADIFSAGVLLYQLVTGEKPFHGDSMSTVMHMVLNVQPVDPAKLNLQISTTFGAEIAKALAKRPEDRFQTARAFAEAIVKTAGLPASAGLDPLSSLAREAIDPRADATILLAGPPPAKSLRLGPESRKNIKLLLYLLVLEAVLYGGWRWYSASSPPRELAASNRSAPALPAGPTRTESPASARVEPDPPVVTSAPAGTERPDADHPATDRGVHPPVPRAAPETTAPPSQPVQTKPVLPASTVASPPKAPARPIALPAAAPLAKPSPERSATSPATARQDQPLGAAGASPASAPEASPPPRPEKHAVPRDEPAKSRADDDWVMKPYGSN